MTGVLDEQCLLPLKSMKGDYFETKRTYGYIFCLFQFTPLFTECICSFSSKCHLKQRVKVELYLKLY